MKALLVPPHGDVSLEAAPDEGWAVADPGLEFVERVTAPEFLTRHAVELEASGDAGGELPRALLARCAAELLASTAQPHTWLRACGAALASVSGPPSSVRLRLDDLELARGTTEASADVLAAAAGPAPYDAELDAALARCREAGTVRLVVDRDQRLPAALSLAARLAGRVRLEVAGTFAWTHRAAMARLAPLAGAEFLAAEPRWRLRVPPGMPGGLERWDWWPGTAGTGEPPAGARAWAGRVPLHRLLAGPAALGGCRVAVVAFCAVDGQVLGPRGRTYGAAELRAAVAAVRAAGCAVVAEWLVGAPGVDRARLEAGVAAVASAAPFDRLAGFRRFTWPAGRPTGAFAGVDVTVGPAPDGHDLARSRPFAAPRTVPDVEEAIGWLAAALPAARGPGSCAAAYVTNPPPATGAGSAVALDPDCAVVRSPEGWRAVNLRTGTILALDDRLAPHLRGLRDPTPLADALPAVPASRREALSRALLRRGVLAGASR